MNDRDTFSKDHEMSPSERTITNEELIEKLHQADEIDEVLSILQEAGIDTTEEELIRQADEQSDELTEENLETVTGGVLMGPLIKNVIASIVRNLMNKKRSRPGGGSGGFGGGISGGR